MPCLPSRWRSMCAPNSRGFGGAGDDSRARTRHLAAAGRAPTGRPRLRPAAPVSSS
jgi:hypothetical protein